MINLKCCSNILYEFYIKYHMKFLCEHIKIMKLTKRFIGDLITSCLYWGTFTPLNHKTLIEPLRLEILQINDKNFYTTGIGYLDCA